MEKTTLKKTEEVINKAKKLPPDLFNDRYIIHESILSKSLAALLLHGIPIRKRLFLKKMDGSIGSSIENWN